MNMKAFFNALSENEKAELLTSAREWEADNAKEKAQFVFLNNNEKQLLYRREKLKAIRCLADRCGVSSLVARCAVENYEDSK